MCIFIPPMATINMQTTTTMIIYIDQYCRRKKTEMVAQYERKKTHICKSHLFILRVYRFLFLFYRIALRIKPVTISNNKTDINVAVVIKQHFFYEKTKHFR